MSWSSRKHWWLWTKQNGLYMWYDKRSNLNDGDTISASDRVWVDLMTVEEQHYSQMYDYSNIHLGSCRVLAGCLTATILYLCLYVVCRPLVRWTSIASSLVLTLMLLWQRCRQCNQIVKFPMRQTYNCPSTRLTYSELKSRKCNLKKHIGQCKNSEVL
jgi:hypothetical protein